MDSLVLELQRKALDKNTDVSELVRMALVVARKLGLENFERWTEFELSGYGKQELPEYRIVEAVVKAHDPNRGWMPVIFEDSGLARAAEEASCGNPIGELQYMVANKDAGAYLHQPFDHEVTKKLMRGSLVPTRLISIPSISGILDAVRNTILRWALELEQNQILGEGLTFSAAEKTKAASAPAIHITNFHGVLGDVQAEQFQIGDYNSIHKELKRLGISQDGRNELENILDEIRTAKGKKKQSLAKRGLAWVAEHAETLGKLAGVVRRWFDNTV